MSRTFKLVKQATPSTEEFEGEDISVAEFVTVEVVDHSEEKIPWYPVITVEKYANEEDHKAGRRTGGRTVVRRGNILTDLGANRIVTLITGGVVTALDGANAKLAFGDSSTAASAGQTALQGTNTLSKAMDGGFPTVSSRVITLRASVAEGEGNFEWREWGVMVGTLLVNRKTGTFGIKLAGAIWVATVTLTI